MKILIIEDEAAAAEQLLKLVQPAFPDATIEGPLDTVEDSISWLAEAEQHPDLIFMDIQLADGMSFDIFSEAEIHCPVIFTTAFDQHALKAFQHNGIEYLLKPIKTEAFEQAVQKFNRWTQEQAAPLQPDWAALLQQMSQKNPSGSFQKRLVIRYGQQIKALEIKEAAFFYIESKVTILKTFEGKSYPVDQNLEELESILDPAKFFRINRKMIVNIEAIHQMSAHTKSRVRLALKPAFEEEVVVSAERSPHFKEWLKGIPG